MRKKSLVYNKAYDFAVQIVKLYRKLSNEKKEYILSKQLVRSGTSIAANIREGLEGQSKKDFISKLSISLKEAAETEYWLELFVDTDILEKDEAKDLLKDIGEIKRMLASIIKTSKQNLNQKT